MKMGYALVIGANSDIGKAIAYEYAKNGYDLYLVARNSLRLHEFASDLEVRFRNDVKCLDLDILDFSFHREFYQNLPEKPSGVISVVGYLGEQNKGERNFKEAQAIIETNYTGIMNFIEIVAADFVSRKNGFIIGVSSVAGDRGRMSNYLYGAAKAAFSTYLSGLRNRVFKYGINVLTVKPGFVDTQMTKGMDLPKILTAKPSEVAKHIFLAQAKGKDIIYTKKIWCLIMLIIRNIPEFIFKRMSL